MDSAVNAPIAGVEDPRGGAPPLAPRDMPTQALHASPACRFRRADFRVRAARACVVVAAVGLTIYGFEQMRLAFGNDSKTLLQDMLLVLFTITFGWIALSAAQAIASLIAPPRRIRANAPTPADGRIALLMPVYHEDPSLTSAALFAMGEALVEAGQGDRFEIFILSDSGDPAAWARETAAFQRLRAALRGRMAVWYRRRDQNVGKKAGNLRDFVERWGRRYDYMVVLDADSLIAADTLVELARRMDADPTLGILQTTPMLASGQSLFARLQQFASRLYGPVIARAVSAWQGLDGNYWGHNAIIRVEAFADHCGLPVLEGAFGGHIMSHDFVEAALVRRAGWRVRMDPDLEGSWEGSPPSLLDLAQRDRRWAEGNLQHLKVLGARGLRPATRAHFLLGVGAYLMSPIWLALLLVGLSLTAQTLLVEPDYFPNSGQLFPNWPVFDAERMRHLFFVALALLLLPKAMGLVRVLASRRARRRFGGAWRVVMNAFLEVALSALYAPVLMLIQTRQFVDILRGRKSGWSAQSREGGGISWRDALRRHWLHVLAALIPTAVLFELAPDQLIWVSPVVAGLILAPALSKFSGDERIGRLLRRLTVFQIPEEREEPAIHAAARAARAGFRAAADVALLDLAYDREARARHIASLTPPNVESTEANLPYITAKAKIEAAETPEQALGWLDRPETMALLGAPDLLQAWAGRARRRPAAVAV